MNTLTPSIELTRPPEIAAQPAARAGAWSNIVAIAGVVLKEMYRRKDFYVLFVFLALITLVMGSVSIFHEDKIVRYLKEICLFLIWGASLVAAVTMTARQIPFERENRTLFPLLAKPVTRTQLLLGKFMGCWLASGLGLVAFYTFLAVVAGAKDHQWPLIVYLQAVVLHWFMLGIVCSMTLLGSLVFAAPSSTNTITLVVAAGILLLGRHLNKVALKLAEPTQSIVYGIYFAIPHLEFFDVRDLLVHSWPPVAWSVVAGALLYAAAYAAFFLTAACLLFRRRAIN